MHLYHVVHHPREFTSQSGMLALATALEATTIDYEQTWQRLQDRSWALGHTLRSWGNRMAGSSWNALVPWLDERRILRAVPRGETSIVHFLWGEFASPRRPAAFRRRGARLVGTFHCSARRQPSVLAAWRDFREYDALTLMSASQMPFFAQRGYPADRMRVILHGVDTHFFRPAASPRPVEAGGLRMLLVGFTERDHEFAAKVMARVRDLPVELRVLTFPHYRVPYQGLEHVVMLERMDDQALIAEYHRADLLFMPMLDCTANNAVLESMACGTPVMANRIGGIPEYVDPGAGFIMEGKKEDEWADLLRGLVKSPERVHGLRAGARRWCERFDWSRIAAEYRTLYDQVLERERLA
jgi:glycosyltransferase involved in cell wall biosynthesis